MARVGKSQREALECMCGLDGGLLHIAQIEQRLESMSYASFTKCQRLADSLVARGFATQDKMNFIRITEKGRAVADEQYTTTNNRI